MNTSSPRIKPPVFEDIDSILGISLVPEEAYGTFKQHVSSHEEFASIECESAQLLVDELAKHHPTVLASPSKRRLLLSNLLTLVANQNGGNTAVARQAMEGSEVAERLRKEADRLKQDAKKDLKTSVLEFEGNLWNYFDVLDKIEALYKRRPFSEEKKMSLLLDAFIDADFRETVIQLRREIKKKAITICKDILSELRSVETHLDTGETEDPMKPSAPTFRRTTEQQDLGSGPDSAGVHEIHGGSTILKASDLRLPKELFKSLTPTQKAWFMAWRFALKKGVDPKRLAAMPKPTDDEVARYQKKAANSERFKEGRSDRKQNKKRKQQKTNVKDDGKYRSAPAITVLVNFF
jgi:hypothetical protein